MDPSHLRKLVISAPLTDEAVAHLRQRFPDVQIVHVEAESIRNELADADAVVSWGLSPADLAAAPNVKWLQTIGAGVDGVLSPELLARDIVVTNNSGVHAHNMSEHVFALMLAFARRLPFLIRGQIAHDWRDEVGRRGVFELDGQTLLLVGLGDIAQATAKRAEAFGMTVCGVRRRTDLPVPPHVSTVFGIDRLHEALPLADHVVSTLPLTPRTRGLLDAEMLAHMKPTAYIYNLGRGPVINSEALIASLQRGEIAGAGLDVTDPEPLPVDSPLWDMENVIITAHTSGSTPKYWARALPILEENIARFREGRPLINVVDRGEGY
ncbi:MAG: D-2-hydroxyacid dehydrogenase [Thermomicrobiales bacterium]